MVIVIITSHFKKLSGINKILSAVLCDVITVYGCKFALLDINCILDPVAAGHSLVYSLCYLISYRCGLEVVSTVFKPSASDSLSSLSKYQLSGSESLSSSSES